jgi:hypothetical protein
MFNLMAALLFAYFPPHLQLSSQIFEGLSILSVAERSMGEPRI